MILLVLVFSIIAFMVLIGYQCYFIKDQTDWVFLYITFKFISYYGALIIDFLIIDLLLLIIQRYLGTDIMKKLKKKIKEAKHI